MLSVSMCFGKSVLTENVAQNIVRNDVGSKYVLGRF